MWRVALTFDTEHADRPFAASGTERVYDVLRDRGVRATAFMQGRWAEAYPDLARRIADDGHLIGNHSYFHARMPLLTSEGRRTDIASAEAAIQAATGRNPAPWFRCPFGAGFDDEGVLADLHASGYRNIHWNVEAADWEPGVVDIVDVVCRGAAENEDSIVLLHPWSTATIESIAGIIDRLRGDGAEFVTVAELA